ncbi:MAG: phage tail protein [Janthinobacterium lividum]
MTTQFLGQIEFFAFGFAPKGWMPCNGQLLLISQNSALFNLLGTTYGGDGRTNFALPNLQGRVVIGPGSGFGLGQIGGEESHSLTVTEMPVHSHLMNADATTPYLSNSATPAANTVLGISGDYTAANQTVETYAAGSPNGQMAPGTIANAGSGQAHENRMPYVVLNACIALTGIYPSRS